MPKIFMCMLFGSLLGAGLAIATEQTAVSERSAYLARNIDAFLAADLNGDGALTLEEAQHARMISVVAHFGRLDVDLDGRVSRHELQALQPGAEFI